MQVQVYPMIGLMSGTSGDGLDIAYVRFEFQGHWGFSIEHTQTVPFPTDLGKKLSAAHLCSGLDLAQLDVDFGKWMGTQVKVFCEKFNLKPNAVASHGHTVFHQPGSGLSLQIGNGWAIHQACGLPVINDFRMRDVQLGGQGAPLVPIGDRLLFPEADFCINLGGISNISMEHSKERIAFDCSPFNLLLNAEAKKLGREFDAGGEIARSGSVSEPLLSALNQVAFYASTAAKSLGREDLERDFFPLISASNISPADTLATLVEHFAFQIGKVIASYSHSNSPKVLITGGGAYNTFFIERLAFHLKNKWEHLSADSDWIEFKEALIFAFLGVLRLRGEVNCLASVTGASQDSCGGSIFG